MIMKIKLSVVVIIIFNSIITSGQTKIIAHRGFSGVAPENTLIAFQKAIECGADYIELDVLKTKDDSIMVIHDASVDRTSSNKMKGKVSEMTYKDLSGVYVGYPTKFGDEYKYEKIPTLREALELAKGKIKVCIEIKVYGAEKGIVKIVNELGVNNGVIIFSFYYPVLAKIRKLDKNIPILYLKSSADALTVDYAKVIEADAIGVGGETTITKEYLDMAHNQGIEIWRWTVNDENEMQQLIDIGIDGLITDFPDKAIRKLSTGNKRH